MFDVSSGGRKLCRLAVAARFWTAFLVFALLLAALSGCAPPSESPPQQPEAQPTAETQTAREPEAQAGTSGEPGKTGAGQGAEAPAVKVLSALVTRVVDGDTVYVSAGGRSEKVRFIGVDTPESTTQVEPYGKEAAAYTARSLAGRKVYLELDVQQRDKYGRLLAYVWLEPPESGSEAEVRAKMFNARLLLDGYAQVMTVPPNVKYADLFVKLQREARDAGKGLWSIPADVGHGSGASYYIGNLRSKKFHRSDCEWAAKMSPANRVYFKTREEALRQEYMPCKVCQP